MRTQAKRVLMLMLAACLALGLCPGAALAVSYTAAVGDYTDPAEQLSTGSTAQTDVKVSVVTAFRVQLDSTDGISIEDQGKLAAGAYTIGATLEDGTGDAYTYYWTRQVWVADENSAQGGAYVPDDAYNSAAQAAPLTVAPDAQGVARVMLNLADDADTIDLEGNARYLYTITAQDGAGIVRTAETGVVVSCSPHYADQTVTQAGIGVRGLLHVGDPRLGVTDLAAEHAPSMSLLLEAADGLSIDSAYDLVISEQQASNHGEPAYLTPLTSVRIPVSDAVGSTATVLRFVADANGATQVETLADMTVHEEDGARFVQIEGVAGLAAGVFAVVYDSGRPTVQVTSDVAASADGRVHGSIDPQGTRAYAQGTQVRFTFAPDEGYVLEKVVVAEGDAAAPASSTTYLPGDAALGANYLDYTVKTGSSLLPVRITAHYRPADTGGAVDPLLVRASVGAGEGAGSVSIVGGTQATDGSWQIMVAPGNGATISIVPEEGSVLDYLEVKTGTDSNQTIEEVAVTGSAYFLSAVTAPTEVVAHFKYGTAVVPVMLTVTCDELTQNGTLSGGGQVAQGSQAAVQVRPDSGYRLEAIWYVTEGEPSVKRDLRDAGSGTYLIDHVMQNCTVSATFVPIGAEEPTATWVIEAGRNGSTDPTGTVERAVSEGALPVQILPETGYVIDVITLNGETIDLSDLRFRGDAFGGTITLPLQEGGGGTLRVTFKQRPIERYTLIVSAGVGGEVSPSGEVEVAPGDPLPLSLIPNDGKRVCGIELTFRNADGTTRTQAFPWGGTGYTVPSVSADLVGVHVTFEDAPDEVSPQVQRVVPRVVAGSGAVSPADAIKVTEGHATLFTFTPADGCEVARVLLDGTEIAGRGAERAYITYEQLAALGDEEHVLEVAFAQIDDTPSHVDVDVTVSVKVDATGAPQAPGGIVSPEHMRVPYDSDVAHSFFLFPDEGYKLVSLKASVAGGPQIDLSYSTKFAQGLVNDLSAAQHGVRSTAGDVSSVVALDAASQSVRHYVFALSHITGDVEVVAEFAPLAAGEVDDAIGAADGLAAEVTVTSGQGGIISPAGEMRLPVGESYSFYLEPDPAWSLAAIMLTYADGTKELLDDVAAGSVDLPIREGLIGIHAVFERTGSVGEEVTVQASALGTGGSVSPTGPFQARKGAAQTFTFTYIDEHAYIKSLKVAVDGVEREVSIYEFATEHTIAELVGDVRLTVEFAIAPDKDNPNIEDNVEYATIAPIASTNGIAGDTTGGTIEPGDSVKVVKGTGAQRFLFKPAAGYELASASVSMGGQTHELTAYELQASEYLVSSVTADAVVRANFVPRTYTVSVEAGPGGSLYLEVQGKRVPQGQRIDVKVRQGMGLAIGVEPEAGYELDSFATSGPIVHEGETGSRAQGATHSFAVAGPGSVKALFKQVGSEGPDEPDDPNKPDVPNKPDNPDDPNGPNNPGGPDDPAGPSGPGSSGDGNGSGNGSGNGNGSTDPAGLVTVTASSSGHGQISPAGERSYQPGATAVFTLKPEVGYQPVSVTITDAEGTRTVAASTTYLMTVERSCEVVANFQTTSAAGSNSAIARGVRTLQSLAQTGDNASAMLLALVAVACGALGCAIVFRRKHEDATLEED